MIGQSISVRQGECVTITQNQHNLTLEAIGLNRDIAFTFLAKGQKVVGGLARSPSMEQIREIFDPRNLGQPKKILIDIVGGDNSAAARKYFDTLMSTLDQIDGGAKVFNITWRVNDAIHPNYCLLGTEELISDF